MTTVSIIAIFFVCLSAVFCYLTIFAKKGEREAEKREKNTIEEVLDAQKTLNKAKEKKESAPTTPTDTADKLSKLRK